MAELTAEQLEKAQTMTLDELRALAIKEAEGLEVVEIPPIEKSRDEKGRFTPKTEDEPPEGGDKEPPEDDEPQQTIYRKEIINEDGQVEVFEAQSLEELVDKIAEGKRNLKAHLKTVLAEKHELETKTKQATEDDEYVIQERLKKEPKKVIKELLAEERAAEAEALRKSNDAQNRFVATHPDFIPNPENGGRLVAWLQSHGHAEITYDGLEKAYQDLKKSGLLVLKAEGSEEATEAEPKETQRIVEPKVDATQPRSQKKGSTIPTRSRTPVTPTNTQPSEDEAYAMPLEKLRELANKQLSERQAD
jgi:hypothetical protein